MTQPAIETVALSKTFRDFWGRARVEALRGLDLRIEPGETFGLLGPNGAGKTTTIKLLLGLLRPTSGRALVLGRPPTDTRVKARIGFLPEESYLYRFLTARECVDFVLRLFRVTGRERRHRTTRLLDRVGLGEAMDRRIGEFSKGMARRVGLACALANDPDLLVLDEPTSGLDPLGSREMKDHVRAAAAAGKTVLVSSHVLADVQETCSRVAILKRGSLALCGSVADLLAVREVTQLRVTTPSPARQAELVELLEQRGVQVLGVEHPRYTLEELFLEVIGAGPVGEEAADGSSAPPRNG